MPFAHRPVRVALQLAPEHGTYADIREAARRADELGVDALYNWDHFWPLTRGDRRHFEAWTMLGAWAETTTRTQIGCLVTGAGYRNPDLLADMARTVDHISDGRLVLGLGAGFREREYLEYGYEFPTAGGRVDILADALARITRRFTELEPPPTRRIPLIIGGDGERRMLRLVARYADVWNSFAEGDDLARKIGVLERNCADIGRDMADIECSVLAGGDPTEVAPAYRDLGVSTFVVSTRGPDFDLTELATWIAWRDRVNG